VGQVTAVPALDSYLASAMRTRHRVNVRARVCKTRSKEIVKHSDVEPGRDGQS